MGAAHNGSVELIAIDPIQTDRATTHQPGANFTVAKQHADELLALGAAKLSKPGKGKDKPDGDGKGKDEGDA